MAERKTIRNVLIQQHAKDINEWAGTTLLDKELGVVYTPGTKDVRYLAIGDGTSSVDELIAADKIFRIGLGADYELPVASEYVLGGVKINTEYFNVEDDTLIPNNFRLVQDTQEEIYNKNYQADHNPFISLPDSDFKIQGDLYAENVRADAGIFKTLTYEEEIQSVYESTHIDIHESLDDFAKIDMTVSFDRDNVEVIGMDTEVVRFTKNWKNKLFVKNQTLSFFTGRKTQTNSFMINNSQDIVEDVYGDYWEPDKITGKKWTYNIETDNAILRAPYIEIGWWPYGSGATGNPSFKKTTKYDVDITSVLKNGVYINTLVYTISIEEWDNTKSEYYYSGNPIINLYYTVPTEITVDIKNETEITEDPQIFYDSNDRSAFYLYIEQDQLYLRFEYSNIITSEIIDPCSIQFYYTDNKIEVLHEDERSGIRINNYHKDDKDIEADKRRVAELSIDWIGTLAYTTDNSDPSSFNNILMLNPAQAIDGFLTIKPDEATGFTTVPVAKIERKYLETLALLNLNLNNTNLTTYSPLAENDIDVNINACTSIIANGTTYQVDPSGIIALSNSSWTNELYDQLQSAVQTITFDGNQYIGPTPSFNSKITSVTMDGNEQNIVDGKLTLSSKIQSITYDNTIYSDSHIVLKSTVVANKTVSKGTGSDVKDYTTIQVEYNSDNNAYILQHYEPNTSNEPIGYEPHVIGVSDTKSFILMHGLKYDYYGHSESYSNYQLDFSDLIKRIEELETKVAELEEQLKAS